MKMQCYSILPLIKCIPFVALFFLLGLFLIPSFAEIHAKETEISKCNSGKIISNSQAAQYDVLINKSYSLNKLYKPKDLVTVNIPFPDYQIASRKQLRADAAVQLEKMYAAMRKEKLALIGVSGFRSYTSQKSLLLAQLKSKSFARANATVACPGQSEHQSGLAIDVSSLGYGGQIGKKFENTKEYKWLVKNAHQFGYIVRYPKNKTSVTKYQFEPWHLRYVGISVAKELKTKKWALEEYLKQKPAKKPTTIKKSPSLTRPSTKKVVSPKVLLTNPLPIQTSKPQQNILE